MYTFLTNVGIYHKQKKADTLPIRTEPSMIKSKYICSTVISIVDYQINVFPSTVLIQ